MQRCHISFCTLFENAQISTKIYVSFACCLWLCCVVYSTPTRQKPYYGQTMHTNTHAHSEYVFISMCKVLLVGFGSCKISIAFTSFAIVAPNAVVKISIILFFFFFSIVRMSFQHLFACTLNTAKVHFSFEQCKWMLGSMCLRFCKPTKFNAPSNWKSHMLNNRNIDERPEMDFEYLWLTVSKSYLCIYISMICFGNFYIWNAISDIWLFSFVK